MVARWYTGLAMLSLLSLASAARPYSLLPDPASQDLPPIEQAPAARRVLGERGEALAWHHSNLLLSRQRADSCWSQHEQHLYYNKRASMSEEFERALDKYEEMHRRCTVGVDWDSLKQQQQQEQQGMEGENATSPDNGDNATSADSCKYLVYLPAVRGLGNRLIALVSTFALGMLTNRAVLVPDSFVASHLCNPFRASSWTLSDEEWQAFNASIGPWEEGANIEHLEDIREHPSVVLSLDVDLTSIANASAATFFCPETHNEVLSQIPVLLLKTDVYLIPALHFIPQFDEMLRAWFPDGRAFLHLGRFLIHPVNKIWFRITRYYDAYLRHHTRIVGVQVRQYYTEGDETVDEQVLKCLRDTSGVLQDWKPEDEFLQSMKESPQRSLAARQGKSMAILVTSLQETHADAIFDFVTRNVPSGGEAVSILRLSHEGQEKFESEQFEGALAEMMLLSMSDELLTTDFSTFGYVAAGLSGLPPFSMNIVSYLGKDWQSNGRPECQRITTEPCMHQMPAGITTLECGASSRPVTEIHSEVHQCDAINTGLQYQVANSSINGLQWT